MLAALCATSAVWAQPATRPGTRPAYEPTSAYEPRRVEGWPVLVSKRLLARQGDVAAEAIKVLQMQ